MSKVKRKKGKLPKTIAGVKVPKKVRRQAEQAIAQLQQPIVRQMIAGAVGMAATALAKQADAARRVPDVPQQTIAAEPDSPPTSSSEAKPLGKSSGEQFAEIATGLAMAALGKIFEKTQAVGECEKSASKF